ncbi:AI-2E family transporter [Wenzhouxiangella sp. EGI_FJ10409]|uniref:AI-2E family transporter n=1 Tax=Wenzhouxiangella sp. EGI_FJ10409 TaxID=3243767 RepID=UPI0035DBCE19
MMQNLHGGLASMEGNTRLLFYSVALVTGIFFSAWGLIEAKNILAPLITAISLALVILPLAKWMERHSNRAVSSLVSTFLLFALSLIFLAVLSYQTKVFVDSWPEILETMEPKIVQWKAVITDNTFLGDSDLDILDGLSSSGDESGEGAPVVSMAGRGVGYIGTYLLTLIYVFFILNYRHRFRTFLLRLFADEKGDEVDQIIQESGNVVVQYLLGKLILIGVLALAYSIGLGITGVSNFILVSIMAAVLTLIPYLGNIIGFVLAMVFGYLTSGEVGVLIGILITFTIAQFLESYILQPYVVGQKVDVHPFIVILAVIVGNALWGVIGMILAIPVMGIITILFLHIPALKPFGYLFSNREADI